MIIRHADAGYDAKILPLESEGTLIQGGERYRIATKNQAVAVDWIVRKDGAKIFYQNALKDAVMIGSGISRKIDAKISNIV